MRIEKFWLTVLIVSITIKIGLMFLGIGGFDFIHTFKVITYSLKGIEYTTAPWAWFIGLFYRLWLHLPLDHSGVEKTLIGGEGILGFDGSLLVFLLKFPLLILDILCGAVLSVFTKRLGLKSGLKIFTLWMLNPYTTLVVEMGGSMDILPVLLIVVSIFLFLESKFKGTLLGLVVGIGIKLYPVLAIPMLVIFSKYKRRAASIIFASIIGAALYFYWVWRTGWDPLHSLLNYSPFTFHISEYMLTPYDSRIGLATMLAFIYSFLVYRFWDRSENSVLSALTGFLLVYFAFLNWWPGYLLFLICFLILHSYISNHSRLVYFILILIAFIFELSAFDFGFNKFLFFVPFYFDWMRIIANGLYLWSSHFVVKLVIEPIIRSAFAALSIYQASQLLIQNSSELSSILRRVKYV